MRRICTPGIGSSSYPTASSTTLAGRPGWGRSGLVRAALNAGRDSASETVRAVHRAVLEASEGELSDDATAVCLLAG